MGFFPPATELLLQEHMHRPLTGRILMIGRQNTGMTPRDSDFLLETFGVAKRKEGYEIDASTIHRTVAAKEGGHVTDRSFFEAFADCTVEAIDVSAYEGAEIIHDLSLPVPDTLRGQFDFIYDGSTLDNVFDASMTLRNMAELLAVGGRALLMNWSNASPTAYTMCSPDWFMDYFVANDFADAQVFVIEIGSDYGRGWRFEPFDGKAGYRPSEINGQTMRVTLCLVEKGERTTSGKRPVQVHYRSTAAERKPYVDRAKQFSLSPRAAYRFPRIGPISGAASIGARDSLLNKGDSQARSS